MTKEGSIEPFVPQDFIAFGLVLLISNINEMEHLVAADRSWKTAQNGISACLIAVHGVLLCLTLIGGDAVDRQAIMYCVAIIALASLGFSYTLFTRISKIGLTRRRTFHDRNPRRLNRSDCPRCARLCCVEHGTDAQRSSAAESTEF